MVIIIYFGGPKFLQTVVVGGGGGGGVGKEGSLIFRTVRDTLPKTNSCIFMLEKFC